MGLLIYKELDKDSVVIEPFQVPADLEKQNITGQAMVNKLVDQIEIIKANADTGYKILDFKPVFYDTQLEIVIPGSGISLKSLLQNVKSFLGRKQTRITGEVVLNKLLYLTIRVQGEPSNTFSGELKDLDSLLGQAAEYVLKYTQPYVLAYYLYYNYSDNKQDALEMIQYSLSHAPASDDAMAYTLDGNVKYDEKKFEESIKLFKKAIETDPKYIDAYNSWGYSLFELKKYDEATAIYKKALIIDPKNTYTLEYYGILLDEQKKYDEAIEMFKKSLQSDPSNSESYVGYGVTLTKTGKYNEANEMFDKAIELDPKSYEAYFNTGNLFAEMKNYKEALNMYNKTLELQPGFADAITGAARVYEIQDSTEKSVEMYSRALKIDSMNKEIYEKLGMNLEKLRKYSEANKLYKSAIVKGIGDSSFFANRIEELVKLRSE